VRFPPPEIHLRDPVATEEADHAQVEGSSAAPFARNEPASDRSQLLDFAEHRPRVPLGRPSGQRQLAAAGGLVRPERPFGIPYKAHPKCVTSDLREARFSTWQSNVRPRPCEPLRDLSGICPIFAIALPPLTVWAVRWCLVRCGLERTEERSSDIRLATFLLILRSPSASIILCNVRYYAGRGCERVPQSPRIGA